MRNPSIQQYTARNIQLLREQEERNQDRVFALEDAIVASGHELVVALDAADLDKEQSETIDSKVEKEEEEKEE